LPKAYEKGYEAYEAAAVGAGFQAVQDIVKAYVNLKDLEAAETPEQVAALLKAEGGCETADEPSAKRLKLTAGQYKNEKGEVMVTQAAMTRALNKTKTENDTRVKLETAAVHNMY